MFIETKTTGLPVNKSLENGFKTVLVELIAYISKKNQKANSYH